MWAARTVHRRLRSAISHLGSRNLLPGSVIPAADARKGSEIPAAGGIDDLGGTRFMSVARGSSSMRSRVERRMRRETGKTLREIRRARKLRKKLMTDEERLMYNLRRAKKKVALLLQKLKKYELPELPAPRHDPEVLTQEQLQAYKKIGFRNRNYVPVGVRGVFGGVVQNMHLHWKFHETVQVCCDNYPKEKIKDMATMLARLSGGIVVNIHNVNTIIMFRGRNYRQPKNLIPINTLTKRKALFKARFEQALESQKLNIKKLEQELRRKGINPEDPVALASIQRVAATFFRAIDERQGTPYVYSGDVGPAVTTHNGSRARVEREEEREEGIPSEDSDQEELDRFIAEIEAAADREFEEEEAAEREEVTRIRYWAGDSSNGPGLHDRVRWVGGEENGGSSVNEDLDSEEDLSDGNDEEDESFSQRKGSSRERRDGAGDGSRRGLRGGSLSLDSDGGGKADGLGRWSSERKGFVRERREKRGGGFLEDESEGSSAAEELDSEDDLLYANDPDSFEDRRESSEDEPFSQRRVSPRERSHNVDYGSRRGEQGGGGRIGGHGGWTSERKSFGRERRENLGNGFPGRKSRETKSLEDDHGGKLYSSDDDRWESDDEEVSISRAPRRSIYDYKSSSEEEE